MVTNIDALADKIYQEGVAKAQNEADAIIENATKKADEMVKEAQKNAEQIIEKAKKEALEIHKNALSDVELASNKAINTLKQEIRNMVRQKILKPPIELLFSDERFLKDLIITIAKNYPPEGMKIVLPENMRDKFDKALTGSLQKEIGGLTIDFNKKLSGGFQVVREDLDYIITFSDNDFIEFFKPFLNENTQKALFKDQA